MESQKCMFLYKISTFIIFKLEAIFYWYGKSIGKRPLSFITFCLILTAICSLGIFRITKENRPFKLWIPQDSDFIKVMDWQIENFPLKFRVHRVIYEAENVLAKDVILEMFKVHEIISNTSTKDASWNTVCAKLPVISTNLFGRKKRSVSVPTDNKRRSKRQSFFLSLLSRDEYCDLIENAKYECLENSLLEIWGYDKNIINALSEEEIINDLNEVSISSVFGFSTNFTKFLGSITKDNNGRIIKAKAMLHTWVTEIKEEEIKKGNNVPDDGIGMVVDNLGFQWEGKFIETILNISHSLPNGFNMYVMAMSSFGRISDATIHGDAQYLALGFGVVFIYIQIMLGKFNLVEQRPLLSFFGISCVGLSAIVSYGLCSAAGVPFGPVNNILPFLLLGLGVDDMFVFIQAWNNLTSKEKKEDLPIRVGLALKHAGVSITITSLTDFVAFAIGSSTVLPALRYFCLYAAVGIIAVYFFQATFFIAWFTLDQKRLEDNRQGLFWCIKLKNWTPNKFSQKDYCQLFFKNVYSEFLLKPYIKALVLIFTGGLLGVSIWGLYHLEQEFDPIWFLPQRSHLYKFFMKLEEHFPSNGHDGVIYFGNISLAENGAKLTKLVKNLNEDKYVGQIDSWFEEFTSYWNDFNYSSEHSVVNESIFSDHLSEFLFSPVGSKYRLKNFHFDGQFNCSNPAPPVLASSITYKHNPVHGSKIKIGAMESVKAIVKNINFSGEVYPWARTYSNWETDRIIEVELYRNITMAMIVVGIMTLVLIASITTSFMVLLCVVITLVDVGALMHWWGLTIDTVSCIDIVLAVGLCVDYAAHIGHTFMIQRGTRDQRIRSTLEKIGPAVLNGGFSTILSFMFLIGSDSHVFITFYKTFFAVCIYGLYHGLVFLPVLLSMIGPPSYKTLDMFELDNNGKSYPNCNDEDAGENCLADNHKDAELKQLGNNGKSYLNCNDEDAGEKCLADNHKDTELKQLGNRVRETVIM